MYLASTVLWRDLMGLPTCLHSGPDIRRLRSNFSLDRLCILSHCKKMYYIVHLNKIRIHPGYYISLKIVFFLFCLFGFITLYM